VLPLLLATRNAHKTREFAEILGRKFVITDLNSRREVPPVTENGATFAENAILKAVTTSRLLSGLVVADDSGLEVGALGGAPGVYSARYAREGAADHENITKLLTELRRVSAGKERSARFCCALALARDGETLALLHGEVSGSISEAPRGTQGFGYDSVFVPLQMQQTFGELGSETKNRLSHRARAIVQLRETLLPC